MAKILIVGNGGREHAIAWKLAESSGVEHIYVGPGNAGTLTVPKTTNIALNVNSNQEIVAKAKELGANLVIVGPEIPLANGIANELSKHKIQCFGPTQGAAKIESSKDFAKSFMDKYGIPTAKWQSFKTAKDAKKHIENASYEALVVKADGLAAGKGVIVAENLEQAHEAVDQILGVKTFGAAGETIVIEEYLRGHEISVLCFSDGKTIAVMPPAQDHKRVFDGDTGPNTGGMGAYAPCPIVTESELQIIETNILQKAIDGLKQEGHPFIGVLFAGIMLTRTGPKVLEFNCRFGDPETEAVLPLLESDLYEVILSCLNGKLSRNLSWKTNTFAVGVVLASGGYPGVYETGKTIKGLDTSERLQGTLVFHAGTKQGSDNTVLTSGGRVIVGVGIDASLTAAITKAYFLSSTILFENKQFRRDIGSKALLKQKSALTLTYKDSGVDINAGDELVQAIKPLAAATSRSGNMGHIGGFGGLFDLKASGYNDPLLVSGTDGVGTKLKIAIQCNIHDTIGIDLVAMCVNDVLAHNAEPLFFLDYYACGKLDVEVASKVIRGVAEGCKLAGCSLIGGETAEMPGVYAPSVYDLAGFAVGAVERNQLLPRVNEIQAGDIVIGISSSGVHSNGFSLVRKIVERSGLHYDSEAPFGTTKTLGEALLTPTKIYTKFLLKALRSGKVKAYAHITGGGLTENIPRVLPDSAGIQVDAKKWEVLPVFGWLATSGNIPSQEMLRTFNCGLGAILIVSPTEHEAVLKILGAEPEEDQSKFGTIGKIIAHKEGQERVQVDNFEESIRNAYKPSDSGISILSPSIKKKKKVAVLISGTGTNLQALIDFTTNPINDSSADIALVISNKPGVLGLERAKKAGIETLVISHKEYPTRVDFDMAMHKALVAADIELICLAGFMRILTPEFVNLWIGRMLNIHPALLPSFKGANGHKLALEAGVRISGCTVHFVAAEVDAGAILVQEATAVEIGDTEETLAARIHPLEHKAYVKALDLVSSEQVKLGDDGKLIWNLK